MRVTVKGDLGPEAAEAKRSKNQLTNDVKDVVKAVSFAVERRLKSAPPIGIPRDTGRAAASWGHWSPSHLRGASNDAGPNDSVWEENDDLSITQGSNVEYLDELDKGHSQQTPAGFIDAAAEAGMRELDKELDTIIRGF